MKGNVAVAVGGTEASPFAVGRKNITNLVSLVTTRVTTSDISVWINGTVDISNAPIQGTVTSPVDVLIGARRLLTNSDVQTQTFPGNIYEIIVYPSALNDDER